MPVPVNPQSAISPAQRAPAQSPLSMGRFLPPDHSKGDEHTLGGYMAVHARPAAFAGEEGASYSADIGLDETGDATAPVGA